MSSFMRLSSPAASAQGASNQRKTTVSRADKLGNTERSKASSPIANMSPLLVSSPERLPRVQYLNHQLADKALLVKGMFYPLCAIHRRWTPAHQWAWPQMLAGILYHDHAKTTKKIGTWQLIDGGKIKTYLKHQLQQEFQTNGQMPHNRVHLQHTGCCPQLELCLQHLQTDYTLSFQPNTVSECRRRRNETGGKFYRIVSS